MKTLILTTVPVLMPFSLVIGRAEGMSGYSYLMIRFLLLPGHYIFSFDGQLVTAIVLPVVVLK